MADARFYRLASDRSVTHQTVLFGRKARESMECRFADQKVGIRLSETLTEKSLSRVNIKE